MSAAAAAVPMLAASSPTPHASASATTGFTNAYVPTACGLATCSSHVYAAKAITVPPTTRNATDMAALSDTSAGDQPAASPEARLARTTSSPPAPSCMAVDCIGGRPASRERAISEPPAQASAAPTSRRCSITVPPAASPAPPLRSAIPARPTPRETTTRPAGRRRVRIDSMTTIHSGIVAQRSAARPDGTVRDTQASVPWLPTNSSAPAAKAAAHWRRETLAIEPRAASHARRMAAPKTQRIAIVTSGGTDSTA